MNEYVYLVMNYLADATEQIVSERVVAIFKDKANAHTYMADIYNEFSAIAGNPPGWYTGCAIYNDNGRFDSVELESDKELCVRGAGGTNYEIVPFLLGRP